MSELVSNSVATPDLLDLLSSPTREIQCPRCRGRAIDDDGADCLVCEGWGTMEII